MMPTREVDDMEIVTVSDAARTIGVCTATIRNWVNTGKLNATRTPNGTRLFLLADVERLARERSKRPK